MNKQQANEHTLAPMLKISQPCTFHERFGVTMCGVCRVFNFPLSPPYFGQSPSCSSSSLQWPHCGEKRASCRHFASQSYILVSHTLQLQPGAPWFSPQNHHQQYSRVAVAHGMVSLFIVNGALGYARKQQAQLLQFWRRCFPFAQAFRVARLGESPRNYAKLRFSDDSPSTWSIHISLPFFRFNPLQELQDALGDSRNNTMDGIVPKKCDQRNGGKIRSLTFIAMFKTKTSAACIVVWPVFPLNLPYSPQIVPSAP